MKLVVFMCWLLRNCCLNVSYLRSQVLSMFEALPNNQSTLKCFYLKITLGTWWVNIDFLSELRNKNGFFYPFLSSALLFNKSISWSLLLYLPVFISFFFKNVQSICFGRKSWQLNNMHLNLSVFKKAKWIHPIMYCSVFRYYCDYCSC